MDVCDLIRTERHPAQTRCDIIDGRVSVAEAVRAFGLAQGEHYRAIERTEADAIVIHILSASLAYGVEIMSRSRATDLWRQFMAAFEAQDIAFVTNLGILSDTSTWKTWSYMPATASTFDLGVLVIGTTKAGCLWIEEED